MAESEAPEEPVKKKSKRKKTEAKPSVKQEPAVKSEGAVDDTLSVEGLAVEGEFLRQKRSLHQRKS